MGNPHPFERLLVIIFILAGFIGVIVMLFLTSFIWLPMLIFSLPIIICASLIVYYTPVQQLIFH